MMINAMNMRRSINHGLNMFKFNMNMNNILMYNNCLNNIKLRSNHHPISIKYSFSSKN